MAAAKSTKSERRRRRGRRRPASSTAAAAALLLSASAAASDGDPHRQQRDQRRRRILRERTRETVARWRALHATAGVDFSHVRPLDLVLDDADPTRRRAYQRGSGGFLEPYDFENYQVAFEEDGGALHLDDWGGAGGGGGDEEEDEEGGNSNSNSNFDSGAAGGGGLFAPFHDREVTRHVSDRVGRTNFDFRRGVGHDDDPDRLFSDRRADDGRGLRGGLAGLAEKAEPDEGWRRRPSPPSVPFFRYTEGTDPEEAEPYEIQGDDLDLIVVASDERRRLQSTAARGFAGAHDKSSSSSAAQGFANNHAPPPPAPPPPAPAAQGTSPGAPPEGTSEDPPSASLLPFGGNKDKAPPLIHNFFPLKDATIGNRQSFGALVSDNGTGVEKVCVQFRDPSRARSECFALRNVGTRKARGGGNKGKGKGGGGGKPKGGTQSKNQAGNFAKDDDKDDSKAGATDVWELSVDGFYPAYAGLRWEFRIRSVDGARNKRSTPWRRFTILNPAVDLPDAGDEEEGEDVDLAPPAPGGGGGDEGELLTEVVRDADWPHGGVVQLSTGRILFFFDGNPYVCTGTVVSDPKSDRTIILTAGHCAYQFRPSHAGGGRFAEHALYVPNQVDTRGRKSNEDCSDDPLGCWIPAFAVVDYEWSIRTFPDSVPWDYGYYVIPNDPEAHEGGFIHAGQPELSATLEEIVEPLEVDFAFDGEGDGRTGRGGAFAHGLGYSFDLDPSYRYCASEVGVRRGIDAYENLWIGVCEMTGGSSGGPWMTEVDRAGRGTVVSVNSWGYATSPGMAGPRLSTAKGSKAECLYERALAADFDEVVDGGIVVDDC
ncbi:hypothetical protein ACHAWF_005892 [Thalassiosira exigua]